MRFGLSAACMLATLALLPAVPAQAQPMTVSETMQFDAEAMKAGEFVWLPHYQKAGTGGAVSIVISIPQQRLYAYQDGQLIAVSTVSTGAPGKDTPTGEFTILQKKVFHRSNLYSNAPMPHMQRLTWDGIALHAGHLPGYPASHGCIRLPKEFAKQLFAITEMGGTVSVVDDFIDVTPAAPVQPLSPLLTASADGLGGSAFDMVTMQDDAAKTQPASWVTGPAREIAQPLPPGSQ
ncbi:MAG: hypothetical protein EOP60_07825 [Sphingomonadales bacterium]|nr:MAG: hypothetical protein EOP60_07825 [Sphingomonadales bacterium]